MINHAIEVKQGSRFGFGENWAHLLPILNDERIEAAKSSLKRMLKTETLVGKTFLDVGSGSGLFSLAAKMLGARVYSFDYDPQSVACTAELKRRYFPNSDWVVETGSVLDEDFLTRIGCFDVVYSWGVLHHTGSMWAALSNVSPLVKPGGQLFIAIYNHQGRASQRWLVTKKIYNKLPSGLRFLVLIPAFVRLWAPTILRNILSANLLSSWASYEKERGMSPWRDVVDWVGGYPFEVSKPEDVFNFYRSQGFILESLTTCSGGLGCNEFVFRSN
jgi:2-polyprenyl-3-methyl-5-hydroxy-6-metoxy-1,4-benzoquinol methylase